jgi:hypothetical protein
MRVISDHCDDWPELFDFRRKRCGSSVTGDGEMIQMHAELVTETQEESPHASPMNVVTSIAVNNMKACAERLAARAKRLAQNPPADAAAERAKQALDAVQFKANLDVLKMPSTKAKVLLDIVA